MIRAMKQVEAQGKSNAELERMPTQKMWLLEKNDAENVAFRTQKMWLLTQKMWLLEWRSKYPF